MEIEESFDLLFKCEDFETTDTILPLVRKCISISPGETEVLRALEIALCYCLKNFSINEVEEELFRIACPAAKNLVDNKLKYLESNPTDCVESLSVFLKIMAYFQIVFEYLNETHEIAIIEVKSLLIATSEILLSCFSHCKISEKIYGTLFDSLTEHLSNFFKKCCELLDNLLNFLTKKMKCDIKNGREVLVLIDVMGILSRSGLVLINLEVKTMAKLWKVFAFLVEKYLNCLKNNYNIEETIKELCSYITSSVEDVFYKGSHDFTKIIKLSCFLLKLVIKFSEAFIGCLKNCQKFLLNLLLMLCKCDAFIEREIKNNPDINSELITQLTIGTDPLLSQLMVDEKFIQECQAVSKDSEKSIEFSIICCLILKKLLDGTSFMRGLWFNENENILEWILLSCSSSCFITCTNIHLPNILINRVPKKFTDLYEYVFINSSAFLMTATADEYRLVERSLIQSILQVNPVRALLAIDIWCILGRFAGSELLFDQILTLGKMFCEFHSETLTTEKWYLASLIYRLYPLLNERHKALFLKSLPPRFCSGFWECCFAALTPDQTTDMILSLVNKVERLLSSDEMEIFKLESESPRTHKSTNSTDNFGHKIMLLWKFNCEALSGTSQYSRFFKTVCTMTADVLVHMISENLLMVLWKMKKLLEIGQPTYVKLYFLYILNSLSAVKIQPDGFQKKILTTTAELFQDLLLTKNAIVKQKAFETFYNFSHITAHGEIISLTVQNIPELQLEVINFFKKKYTSQTNFSLDDFLEELYQLKFEHVCQMAVPTEAVIPKKFKADHIDMEEILIRWKVDSEKIVECFNLLSESQKKDFKTVCGSLFTLPR